MAPQPPPYWAYNENRLLTMTESSAYEDAMIHQQQGRRSSGPPAMQSTTEYTGFMMNASNNAPINNVEGNALRGNGRARSVDIAGTSPTAVQQGSQYAQQGHFVQQARYGQTAQQVQYAQYGHRALQAQDAQQNQDAQQAQHDYYAQHNHYAQQPQHNHHAPQDHYFEQGQGGQHRQHAQQMESSMMDVDSQVHQDIDTHDAEISGYLERLHLNGKARERR